MTTADFGYIACDDITVTNTNTDSASSIAICFVITLNMPMNHNLDDNRHHSPIIDIHAKPKESDANYVKF